LEFEFGKKNKNGKFFGEKRAFKVKEISFLQLKEE